MDAAIGSNTNGVSLVVAYAFLLLKRAAAMNNAWRYLINTQNTVQLGFSLYKELLLINNIYWVDLVC